jgi:exopolysaccharide production protein ExoY
MPILLATAGFVRLLIGKSPFEVHERIGFGGKAFAAYHFCSSIGDREDSSVLLWLNYHPWAESFGGALRSSGLQKLPLLFNVLRGDMSLIGPRPIAREEFSRYHILMPEYFAARPGLTGLWRRSTTLSTQMALDRYYIRYWSVRFDLTLLIKAVSAVV